ncbi:hypothetical protein X777_12220 [Ooceraea biroi]|uniref:Fibronectin type-III domain-containing protein n=2 Tax=Ooceraea biroi TaxID=2015173 RepID=A0A026W0S9_OOCBI|nr:hypothetical protein X777_12220 [Ooceraea biroi]
MRFYNMGQIKPDKNKIDCKMKEGDECIKSWITEKWSISDSLITPFGPVFDERWEDTFLHTIVENATLTSPSFQVTNRTICIQLLIGLCVECDINIILFDDTRNEELKKVTVKSSSKAAAHGLPTWQFVTIEHLTNHNSAIMELRPILNSNSPNPLWAVANVRQCPRKDTPECPEGRIGPRCLEVCKRNNDGNNDCNGTAICYKDGCTCSPGFMGPDCFEHKPSAPTIRFINTTNIEIEAPITWKDEYEESLFYAFIIKETTGVDVIEQNWKPIFRNMTKLELFLQNLKPVPSKILNLRTAFVSNTSVTLTWMVPKSIEEIRWYNVTLQIKEYRGCKNAKFTFDNLSAIHLTNETTITIGNLHPHALYSAQVVVHNSRYASAPVKMIFATKQSDIITEIFSHINMQNWNMSWQPPEDCRTIMGPLYARIYIRGISDTLKNFYAVEETANNHLSLKEIKLCYAEIYVATLYAVRHPQGLENPFANKEYVFETPPGVPPRVTNLEIYEIDNSQTPNIVHLRWQGPLLPHNGILRIYQVRSCDATKCTNTEIQLNAICDLWDDYICASIEAYENNQTIDVVAYNVNVSEAGIPFEVSMANHNAIPDEPGNFTVTIHKYSVVDLQWRHPWKTGNCLEYFHIRIYLISTNLVEENGVLENHDSPNDIKVWVINYSRNYTKQLNLLPSTQYLASIQAVTYSDRKSKVVYKLFETPSTLTFSGQLKYKLYETPPSISVHIPSVLHNTKNSTIHIVVKGPQDFKICDGYSKVPKNLQAQIGVNMNDVAWIAAAFPTDKIAGKSFVVGDGEFYGNANNCPLEFKLLYEITVIVTERNKNLFKKPIMLKISISIDKIASAHYEKWLVPVVIIVGIATAFYFYRRSCCNSEFNFGKRKRMVIRQRVNRRRMPTNEIPMSEQTVYEEIQVIG